ncbi:MAG: phosphatidylglycerophosphatase A [Desulfopila sp.]
MNQLIMAIATGLYVGKIPKAPGTWGSVAALLPWLLIKDLPLSQYCAIIAGTFIVGFLAAGSAEKLLDAPDSGAIVIDEIVGMFITLLLAPAHPLAWLVGLIYFRIFDIAKPFPASWCDQHIHGGIGIMLDDVVAGLYALLALQLSWYIGGMLF